MLCSYYSLWSPSSKLYFVSSPFHIRNINISFWRAFRKKSLFILVEILNCGYVLSILQWIRMMRRVEQTKNESIIINRSKTYVYTFLFNLSKQSSFNISESKRQQMHSVCTFHNMNIYCTEHHRI